MPYATLPTNEDMLAEKILLDSMDDIELKSVQLELPRSRQILTISSLTEVRVPTSYGDVLVAVQGDRKKPAIVTYHDIGLNYASNFQGFFNYPDMRNLLDSYCVYHVNAPGQEDNAPTLPDDYVYPTIEDLSHQIDFVLSHFGIRYFLGFGVGLGANILARYALQNPQKVEGLVLINCSSTQAGWIEWGYQKMNARQLRNYGVTQAVLDYLMWHHFGYSAEERNHDLAQAFKHYFTTMNSSNLAMLIERYIQRSDLNIERGSDTIKVPVLNMTCSYSPHVEDTVTFNGRIDPANSTWMKISDGGMVLEEQPNKISEALRLFLKGLR